MSEQIEKDWNRVASTTLKAELARADIGYEELTKRLARIGVEETYKSVAAKINRGSFSFAFFAQCMEALGIRDVRLHGRHTMVKISQRIKEGYEGKDVKDDPDASDEIGGMMVLHSYHKEFHWSAKLTRFVWESFSRNWTKYLALFFAGISAIAALGIWLDPKEQKQPSSIAPVLNQDNASKKTPPPSTEPQKKFSEHEAPVKNNTKVKSI